MNTPSSLPKDPRRRLETTRSAENFVALRSQRYGVAPSSLLVSSKRSAPIRTPRVFPQPASQTTILRALALTAMLTGAAVGAAHGASEVTLHASAAVAPWPGQHVIFDCSKARVSCEIVATGISGSATEITADITGPNAANVEIVQAKGRPEFTMQIKGEAAPVNSFGSWVASWFHPSSWWRPNAYAVVTLRVPMRSPLNISDTNGNVTVRGVHAHLEISTVNSDVRVSDSANLHVSTVNGSVRARFGAGTPNVHASTVNGGITLLVPSGFDTHVSTSTVNGHTHNPFDSASGAGQVRLSTVNGSITVTKL